MTVVWAEFRKAFPEDKVAEGSFLYKAAAFIPWQCVRAWGTFQMLRSLDDLLRWKEPAALTVFYKAQHWLGFKPEAPLVNVRPTFMGDHYSINDPTLVKQFFTLHRNDPNGVFSPGKGVTGIGVFLKDCFPGVTLEDCILTCSPVNTEILHKLLQKKLNRTSINQYFHAIRDEAKLTLEILPKGETINFSHESQNYLARVFGDALFDDSHAGSGLSEHIFNFKAFLVKKLRNKLSDEEHEKMKAMQESVRDITAKILEREEELHLFDDPVADKMSLAQKQALLFVALFAAQDNTASLLSAAIHTFASLPEEEKNEMGEIARQHCADEARSPFDYPQTFETFFAKVFAKYPPVPGVARAVKEDICMSYMVEGETEIRKVIFPAGSSLSARIIEIAHKTLIGNEGKAEALCAPFQGFGGGPHRCPGRDLAEVEIKEFILQLAAWYKITINEPYDITMKLRFTGVIDPDVIAEIQAR